MKMPPVLAFGCRWFLQGTNFILQVHHVCPEGRNVLAKHNLLLSRKFAEHIFDLGRDWIHHAIVVAVVLVVQVAGWIATL